MYKKEHEREDGKEKEDIYFYLNDDKYTHAYSTPKQSDFQCLAIKTKEEYVTGNSTTNSASGGIQRYKLGFHGDEHLNNNGMFAYIENKSIEEWLKIINDKILNEYPNDSPLILTNKINEYTSTHTYENHEGYFTMYHFWIDLTRN